MTRIDNSFLETQFNFFGLKSQIENYEDAYNLIIFNKSPPKEKEQVVQHQAQLLYGLLHARFLITKNGLEAMHKKFKAHEFQTCPRVYCKGVQCLPYGVSDLPYEHKVKMFCPGCSDIYNCQNPDFFQLDGAFFGSSWVHMFLQRFQDAIPTDKPRVYIPNVFGFALAHESDRECEEEEYSD